ncbi:MAG: TIGR00282 family metallophosphoesterase [Candidatus Omnitrophica bacterium]|nr:TIGR00282 family metallophosphoesterase [Candidatus Omnitrophota bacterium]
MRILVVGDVVGEPGRRVCHEVLPSLQKEEKIDFIIANGENVAGGSGITKRTAEELFRSGVNVITSGDHIFKQKEARQLLQDTNRVLRPANFPHVSPGYGSYVYKVTSTVSIGVVNLLGRVFLSTVDCPFQKITDLIDELKQRTNIIIVDFHAEATSEKIALGWYLDGKVSAVVGTHTHVQTADEVVLPAGTAYLTDVGMTGPFHSVLGREVEEVIARFVTQMPGRMRVATEDLRMNAVIIEINTETGLAASIKRIQKKLY